MNPLPTTEEVLAIAQRVIWFDEPQKALSDPIRFMAYLMTYGTIEDIAVIKRHVGEEGFVEALDKAPPGIIDERSWAYWNIMANRDPIPPMPQRMFGA